MDTHGRQAILARELGADWLVICQEEVSSTMDLARSNLAGLERGRFLLAMASRQSAGRGRQGRSWNGGEGNLYATYAFGYGAEARSLSGLSLAVGLAVESSLRTYGCDLRIKWPNDLLDAAGSKLAGILIELVHHEGASFVLVGIGINLASAPLPGSACLADLLGAPGPVPTPMEIALSLSPAIAACWRRFEPAGFATFREEYMGKAYALGGEYEVEGQDGPIRGRFEGVDEQGALLISSGNAIRAIASGHVRHVPRR